MLLIPKIIYNLIILTLFRGNPGADSFFFKEIWIFRKNKIFELIVNQKKQLTMYADIVFD